MASIVPLSPEMRSLLSPQQAQQQKRRAVAATKAAAARWAADVEAEAHLGDGRKGSPEDSALSWWSASVSEVQALERLIGSKVSKASQLVLDRPAEADDTSAVEELFRSDGSDMLLAVPSAGNPIEATAKANDIAVLREEFARLAAQVRIQEGRFGPWSLALERDVSELRKMISNMKEQMEGRSRETVAERTLDRESLGASLGTELRRELDDLRERCATLTSIVEDLAKAQTRLADSTLAQSTRRYLDADASTVFGPEAQQLCAKVAEETARRVALETRAVSVDSAKDAARKVAEETAGAIVDVAGAVQNEVAQLRQRQGEMLKEMATFRGRPDASASESILADVKASFADAFTRLETSCRSAHTSVSQHREEHLAKHEDLMAKIKASDDAFKNLETSCRTAHDAISRHRDEHRAKHEDLIAKIAASELTVAGLQSRFEHFFAQEHLHSPKALSKLADKTDSPAPATSTMRPQELVELRSDLDAALRDMRELRVERERNSMALTSGLQDLTSWRADIERDVEKLKEERERNSRAFAGGLQDMKSLQGDMERSLRKLEEERTSIDSMLIVDTPLGQVALTSLPGELEELRLQLERIVRELREEKASMTESALAAVEKSRTEQLSSSLQSFRQDIETAISGIRQDVSKVETSCVERIQSSSLQIVRDEMQTVVGTLSKSFAETTERLQSQLQLQQVQQATPRLAADVDALREELEALQEKLQSQLQQQQVHQVQQATLRLAGDVAALRTELEAMRERLQSQLQLQQVQQATPPPTADVDALRAELEALRERADVAVIKSELQTLQEDRVVHQSAIDEGVVFIAKAVGDLRAELSDAREVSSSAERLRGALEQSVANVDSARVATLSARRAKTSELEFDRAQAEKLLNMAEQLGDGYAASFRCIDDHFRNKSVHDDVRLNLFRLAGIVEELLLRQSEGPAGDSPHLSTSMDKLRLQCTELIKSVQVPSDLQSQLSELSTRVDEWRQGQVSPGRWVELREQHADMSRMVTMLQDLHCEHVCALWEDLRAVCRELAAVARTSEEAAAQAAAAQAVGVGNAASQALMLWEELGTPRRAELVGMIGEVRSLRSEDDVAVAVDKISEAIEETPLKQFANDEEVSELGTWQVTDEFAGARVRSKPSLNADILITKVFGTVVRGYLRNGWVHLDGEPGCISSGCVRPVIPTSSSATTEDRQMALDEIAESMADAGNAAVRDVAFDMNLGDARRLEQILQHVERGTD